MSEATRIVFAIATGILIAMLLLSVRTLRTLPWDRRLAAFGLILGFMVLAGTDVWGELITLSSPPNPRLIIRIVALVIFAVGLFYLRRLGKATPPTNQADPASTTEIPA